MVNACKTIPRDLGLPEKSQILHIGGPITITIFFTTIQGCTEFPINKTEKKKNRKHQENNIEQLIFYAYIDNANQSKYSLIFAGLISQQSSRTTSTQRQLLKQTMCSVITSSTVQSWQTSIKTVTKPKQTCQKRTRSRES